MKQINKQAAKVLEKISKESNTISNNKTFMDVHVEIIGKIENIPGTGRLIAVTHYYEQNGDLVTDPEMVFVESEGLKGEKAYYPISFEMGGFRFEESALIENNTIKGVRPQLQRQHATFAGQWMINIKNQQGI